MTLLGALGSHKEVELSSSIKGAYILTMGA